jgi:glycosyltransferase involved in cell wall biosynthesis
MKIATVISACEYPDLVTQAVDSALRQTRPSDGVFVVVDGKSVQEYRMNLYPYGWQVQSIVFPENRGVSAVRNKGCEVAQKRGYDAVYLLDEDDLLTPYAVERMERAAELCPDYGIFYPDRATFGAHISYDQAPEFNPKTLQNGNYIISSVLMRLSAWEAVKAHNGQGFDESLHHLGLRWEDYLFFIEAFLCGVKLCHVGGMAMTQVRVGRNLGSAIANATTERWQAYTKEKLNTIYGQKTKT